METYDMTLLKAGDVVHYLTHGEGKGFFMEIGTLKDDNLYEEGVEVQGEGWKQYVSKYFIQKIERGTEVLFKAPDYDKLMQEG